MRAHFALFLPVIFLTVLSSMAFGSRTSFSKDEIVFPVGKAEIEKFLDLLKDPNNKKVVGFETGAVSYKEIPQEKSAVFNIGASSYMLYWDDFNNDGEKEYFVIYVTSGSGGYSGIQGAYSLAGTTLTSLKINDIIIKNLFPAGDMSRFHPYLARTFAVRLNGKIYLRFLDTLKEKDIFIYKWDHQKFTKENI